MPLTLSITDNMDGTGATAAITGSNPASTNTLGVQKVDGELGGLTWTTAGSRVGDGALALPGLKGFYWGRCDSVFGGVDTLSNLSYFVASDGNDAVIWRAMLAAQARIQGMALSGIVNGSIVIQKEPWERAFGSDRIGQYALPGIIICPFGKEQMLPTEGTNVRDDVGYPILVSILASNNQDLSTNNQPLYLKWREQIARAFRNQRLPGILEIYRVAVEPAAISLPAAFLANYYHSALVLRATSREVRGI